MGHITRRAMLGAVAAAPAFIRAQSKSKPNLVLLMADQHRADWMGCDGNGMVATPNLDRIASEGTRFRNAYSSTPTCTPARSGLLTGMSPWKHGMLGMVNMSEKYPVELPRVLTGGGYYTFAIGKCHYHPQRNLHGFHGALLDESGREQTVDFRSDYRAWFKSEAPNLNPDATGIGWNDYTAKPYVLPERLHPTRWTADCATRFIDTYERSEPFFLKVSFARPHSPYDPPNRFWKRYADSELPKAVHGKWADRYRPKSWERDDIWHGDVGPELTQRSRVGYSGSVSFVDEQIGRVLESLEKRKMLDETVIVYTSDHGDMTGDHFLWRKSYAYEASARIPMLMRGPGVQRGAVNTTPVEIRDILPTFAAAGGIEKPPLCDGDNMLKLKREWIDLEHDVCYNESNHWTSLTDGRWKYIFHAFDGSEQLFDLTSDPHELRELSGEAGHTSSLRLWRGRMTEHLAPRGEQWVSGGKLMTRPKRMTLSPNFPEYKQRTAGKA